MNHCACEGQTFRGTRWWILLATMSLGLGALFLVIALELYRLGAQLPALMLSVPIGAACLVLAWAASRKATFTVTLTREGIETKDWLVKRSYAWMQCAQLRRLDFTHPGRRPFLVYVVGRTGAVLLSPPRLRKGELARLSACLENAFQGLPLTSDSPVAKKEGWGPTLTWTVSGWEPPFDDRRRVGKRPSQDSAGNRGAS